MIAARPTTYNGIPMRSRLEARFAAHLDQKGYRWTYEPRAYADASSQYLPDFQVIDEDEVEDPQPMFVEVRPTTDGAYRAMGQMSVIWASEPGATLMVVVPDEGAFVMWWISGAMTNKKWRVTRLGDV